MKHKIALCGEFTLEDANDDRS